MNHNTKTDAPGWQCVNYFFAAVIKFHDHGNLEKKELILASGSREIRVMMGLSNKQQGWQQEWEAESLHLIHRQQAQGRWQEGASCPAEHFRRHMGHFVAAVL